MARHGWQAKPAVSVIIPTFNRAPLLGDALASVIGQTVTDWEAWVIDDGSTDSTGQTVRGCEHEQISYLRHEHRRGAQAARNTGLRHARGEFVLFLDSDDLLHPAALELHLAAFRKSPDHVGVMYGACVEAHEETGFRRVIRPRLRGRILTDLLWDPLGPIMAMLVRRQLLQRIGPLDESLPAYQEWDLAIRLAGQAAFDFVTDEVAVYRRHQGPSISKDLARCAEGYEAVVRKHQRQVLRTLGTRGLAYHDFRMARLYAEAGRPLEAMHWSARGVGLRLVQNAASAWRNLKIGPAFKETMPRWSSAEGA